MPFDVPPPDPGIEIAIATRGMSKGIAQTDGGQLLGKGFLRFGSVQAGLQWKNVTASTYDGEGSVFVSASRRFGRLQLTGGVARKFATGIHGRTDSASWEFTAGATRKLGSVVAARVNAVFSPDDLGSARRSLFVEAGPVVQLRKGWTASAAIDRRNRQDGVDYTAWNAGIAKLVGPVQVDVRYYDTNRSGAGDFYRGRVVGTVKLAF